MMQLGPLKIGKLTALLLRFHSLPSKNDRRGVKNKRRKRGRAINGDVLNGKLLGNPIKLGSKTKAKTMRDARKRVRQRKKGAFY